MSLAHEPRYYVDQLREAWDDPDIDTPLGQAVARLKVPFVLGDGKKWYFERFVSFLSTFRQALAAIDDSISPDLPTSLLEPASIARIFHIPLEDFNWQGGNSDGREISEGQSGVEERPDGKLDQIADQWRYLSAQDIVDHYQGKISLRLAYQIMDKCQPVRAEKKRLVTAESFRAYLSARIEAPPQESEPRPSRPPATTRRRGQSSAETGGFEFFRFPH